MFEVMEELSPSVAREESLVSLTSGPVLWFNDWPHVSVPKHGSAVYTVWSRDLRFIYVGMAGRSEGAKGKGPWGRLNAHASGRRSGDQFCIYVCDRLVLPSLHNRLQDIANGSFSLDQATRQFIREKLGFRFLSVASPQEAVKLERSLQRGEAEVGKPLLNPL